MVSKISSCQRFLCKIIGAVSMRMVSLSVGTLSLWGAYEHEMPASLIPKKSQGD